MHRSVVYFVFESKHCLGSQSVPVHFKGQVTLYAARNCTDLRLNHRRFFPFYFHIIPHRFLEVSFRLAARAATDRTSLDS